MKPEVKYRIIYRHREEYPISVMCAFFAVSRSGYYGFVHRQGKPKKDAVLAELIAQQQERSFHTYGYRRMWLWLKSQNIYRNPKTVLRIMKHYDLYLYNYRMESTMHRISLSAAPRLIGNDMFSLLYQYMQLWNMVDRRSLEMLSVYYLKNYLSVYFGLRNQCSTSQERKVLRKYPWGQIVNKKAFRHCFSRHLSLKDKLRLLVAAMRL